MNAYQRGRTAEYLIINKLKNKGAELVIRSAGSHRDADIVAIFPNMKEIWLVQVKQSKRGVSLQSLQKEYEKFLSIKGTYNVKSGFYYKSKEGWKNTFEVK